MSDTSSATGPSVVAVEPRPVVALGLERIVNRIGGQVRAVAPDARAGLVAVTKHEPGLAIVGLDLPDDSGIALTERIAETSSATRVLLFADHALAATWDQGRAAGALGIALGISPIEEIERAVLAVAAGEIHVDARLVPGGGLPDALLSAREREVLTLLAHGLDAAEVARHLYLGAETIRTHVQNAIRKLGARTRVEAVVIAIELGEVVSRGTGENGELAARAGARGGGRR